MTVADLTIFQLYCIAMAAASVLGLGFWAYRTLVVDADTQFSWLGYAFIWDDKFTTDQEALDVAVDILNKEGALGFMGKDQKNLV